MLNQNIRNNDVDIVQSVPQSSFSATATKSMMIRSATYVNYNFIPHDDFLFKNDGFCAIDNFVGTYGKLITTLTVESFINMCYEVRGEVKPNKIKQKSILDHDLSDDEDDEPKPALWTLKDGVILRCYIKFFKI
jgi:hypothetical protein